jgi:hypothetical protein
LRNINPVIQGTADTAFVTAALEYCHGFFRKKHAFNNPILMPGCGCAGQGRRAPLLQ